MDAPLDRSAGAGRRPRGFETLGEVASTRALIAAVRTGLWESLSDGACTVRTLADRHGLDVDAVRRVLEVFRAREWVKESEGRWRLDPEFVERLAELPGSIPNYVENFGGLETYLTSGEPTRQLTGGEDYAEVVGELGYLFEPAAEDLAARLSVQPRSVLDLGTGSGVFGIAVATTCDVDRLVGFDRPEVVPEFERCASEAGLEEVAVGWGGDFLEDPLPSEIDCVLICNVLRVLPPEDAKALIGRLPETLGAEGRAVVVDVIGDDPAELSLRRTVYRLGLALRNDSGGPHDESLLREWYRAAGLTLSQTFRLEGAPHGERAHVLATDDT